jgi:hypothetical protein
MWNKMTDALNSANDWMRAPENRNVALGLAGAAAIPALYMAGPTGTGMAAGGYFGARSAMSGMARPLAGKMGATMLKASGRAGYMRGAHSLGVFSGNALRGGIGGVAGAVGGGIAGAALGALWD